MNYHIKKGDNNVSLVKKFMEWGSPMNQMFVIDALSKYATSIIMQEQEVRAHMRDSMISPDAWVQCAKDWITCNEIREDAKIEVKVDDLLEEQEREDLLVTALEGGSNYWYHLPYLSDTYTYKKEGQSLAERIFAAVTNGVKIKVHEVEDKDCELGTLSLESIRKGEALMKTDFPDEFNNIKEGDYDANDADIWFQLCVMGEVIFEF